MVDISGAGGIHGMQNNYLRTYGAPLAYVSCMWQQRISAAPGSPARRRAGGVLKAWRNGRITQHGGKAWRRGVTMVILVVTAWNDAGDRRLADARKRRAEEGGRPGVFATCSTLPLFLQQLHRLPFAANILGENGAGVAEEAGGGVMELVEGYVLGYWRRRRRLTGALEGGRAWRCGRRMLACALVEGRAGVCLNMAGTCCLSADSMVAIACSATLCAPRCSHSRCLCAAQAGRGG